MICKIKYMDTRRVSEFIKSRMNDLGLNQNDLSDRSHLTQSQISRIISEKSAPSHDALFSIAHALQVEPSTIFAIAGIIEKPRQISNPLELTLLEKTKLLTDDQINTLIAHAEVLVGINSAKKNNP